MDGSRDDGTINDFNKPETHFAEIKRFSQIICKVGEKELSYKAVRSRTRPNQWNIYQINIEEANKKEDYCFFFKSYNKQEFVEKFQNSLKKKLDNNNSLKAGISMDGR